LRAAHHVYWTLHWQAQGVGYYGDHLLYQRLYQARVKEIDRVAETIAAVYGADKLGALTAWEAAQRVLTNVSTAPNSGLRVAELTLHAANRVNNAIGSQTHGHVIARNRIFGNARGISVGSTAPKSGAPDADAPSRAARHARQ
jgi:hypothetical protein